MRYTITFAICYYRLIWVTCVVGRLLRLRSYLPTLFVGFWYYSFLVALLIRATLLLRLPLLPGRSCLYDFTCPIPTRWSDYRLLSLRLMHFAIRLLIPVTGRTTHTALLLLLHTVTVTFVDYVHAFDSSPCWFAESDVFWVCVYTVYTHDYALFPHHLRIFVHRSLFTDRSRKNVTLPHAQLVEERYTFFFSVA